MTLRTRRILFYSFFSIFIIATPLIILFANGYRFDFKTRALQKTGGFYLKSTPKKATILIDNKNAGKTPKLKRNLLPREYNVKVQKNGFHTWEKNLKIEEGEVTEARNIFLPFKPDKIIIIESNITRIYTAPNNAKMAYIKESKIGGKELWIINLESKDRIKIHALESSNKDYGKIIWSPDSSKILMEIKSDKTSQWYVVEPPLSFPAFGENEPATVIIKIDYGIQTPQWNKESNEIYFLKNNVLKKINYKKNKLQNIIKDVLSYEMGNGYVYFIKSSSYILYRFNNGVEQLSLKPLPVGGYKMFIKLPDIAALNENGDLYIYDNKKQSFEKIVKADLIKFSPDSKKLLYTKGNELWVYWLRDIKIQPFKNPGDKELIARFSKKIKNATWFSKTNEHLFFIIENKLKMAELDGRGKRNIHYLSLINSDDISYISEQKSLFFILDNNLVKFPIEQ